jgi:hypothetical protein
MTKKMPPSAGAIGPQQNEHPLKTDTPASTPTFYYYICNNSFTNCGSGGIIKTISLRIALCRRAQLHYGYSSFSHSLF